MRFRKREQAKETGNTPSVVMHEVGRVAADGSLEFFDGRTYMRGERTVTETGVALTRYDLVQQEVEVVPATDVEVVEPVDRTGVTYDVSDITFSRERIGRLTVSEWTIGFSPTDAREVGGTELDEPNR